MARRKSNKQVKQMISDVEVYRRNGCLPTYYAFDYHKGDFGYWVWINPGWFFRAVYFGTVSIKGKNYGRAQKERQAKA